MKVSVVVCVGTLALNAVFIAMLARHPPTPPQAATGGPHKSEANPIAASSTKTGIPGAARESGVGAAEMNWAAFDSGDLRELAARLRAAGFPPKIIRAVITSQVEALFAPRMKELVASLNSVPIWQQDPRVPLPPKVLEGRNQLMLERTRVLRGILGSDLSASSDDPDGRRRQFGDIPPSKIDLVQRISEDYAEMSSQVRASMQGLTLPEDREKLALLDRERKADLAAILTPQELEEYEMRTSPATIRLRAALTVMDATEEEFRAIFRVYDAFNDRINPNFAAGGMVTLGASTANDRRAAAAEMMAQTKAALPPERYAAFERAQDRDYQQLDALARQNNLSTDAAIRAFSLRDHFSAESMRLAADRSTPTEQKLAAAQTMVADARTQIVSALGPKAGDEYIRSASWLNALENGRAFTVLPDGGMSMRPIAMPPLPQKKR